MKTTTLVYKSLYRLFLVCFVSSLLLTNAFGATKTFTGIGNFGTPANWNGGTIPAAGDNLRIDGSCRVENNVLTDNVVYGTLTIGNGLLGSLVWGTAGTNRLNVSNINALFVGANILNMANGGTLIIRGTMSTVNLTFTPGTGTVETQLTGGILNAFTSFNGLVINATGTITAGINMTINGNLTVATGTLSVGAFNFTVTGTTTITSTLTITSAIGTKSFGSLIINGTLNNTAANEALTINGNFQNNGVYNGGTGRTTFTGAASNTISGTAATTAFGGGITVNKGTSTANILDVQCVITMLAGGLLLSNGTFKLSSNSTIKPFTVDNPTFPYLIPNSAGLWCNGGVINTDGECTTDGLFRISNGVFNLGTLPDHRLRTVNCFLTVEGGTLNIAGRITPTTAVDNCTFLMTGGTIKLATVGSGSITKAPFDMTGSGSSFTMSGGTIIVEQEGGLGPEQLGFNLRPGTSNVTGGTVQMGDALTPAGDTMRFYTSVPLYNLVINSANVVVLLDSFQVTTFKNNVTITAGTLNTNGLDMVVGGNWINNATFQATTGKVTFNGTGTKTVTGTSTTSFNRIEVDMGTNFTSNILDVLSLITMPAGGLTLTDGTFKLTSNSTITPFIADITTAPFRIPGTAGLWVNGGTVSTPVDITAAGLIRVSNGILNVGDAADERLLTSWATMIIEGGVLNVAGRFTRRVATEGAYLTMTGGTFNVPDIGSTNATVSPFTLDNPGSSFTMSGGTIIIERAGGTNLGYVNLAGTHNVTGGTLQIGNASTPVSQTMLINSSAPIGNLTINAANSPTGQLITNSLTVVNNVTISGGTLNSNNLDFTVGGNWTKAIASVYTQGSGTVTFNGTGAQAINGTSTFQTFNHVVVAKTAGTTLSVLASTTSMGTQNLTETSGNFTSAATLNINGNLLLSAGTFTAGVTTNILGNWTKNGGTFTPGLYVVNFNGTATKTLGGTDVNSFYNLTINTVASADIVRLTNDAIATNILTLTKGVLDLNSNTLFIWNSSSAAITRTNGFILSEKTDNSSKICWNVTNASGIHTYPFCTAAAAYIPFMLTRTDGDLGQVTVSTYPTAANNMPYPVTPESVTNMFGSMGTDNSANTVDRFWQIDKEGLVAQATFTFTATPAEVGSILLPTAQRYESSLNKWQAPLPGQTSTATTATVTGVTNFSPWTLSSQAALLPIQLVSFIATYADPFVSLTWVTESEVHSDFFAIEKTTDEKNFETVCQVKAAGESYQALSYQANDRNPSSGVSYYRLKQTDRDGSASYSDLVAIQITTTDQISISPNPVTDGKINLRVQNHANETLNISVIDLRGKIVFSGSVKLDDSGQSSIVIGRLNNLPDGLYLITVSNETAVFTERVSIY